MTLKNRKTPLIVAAVLIAAVAIGTIVARRSGDTEPDQQAGQNSQTQDASAPPSASAVSARSANSGSATDGRTRLQETVARRQESRQAQIKKSAEQRKNAAEAFQREPVDPAWAPKKEVELNSIAAQPAFETAGAVPKDMRIDCKSSMCRLDGSFTTNGQAEDWVLLYMSSVGSALPNAVVTRTPNPDGTTSVEIYGRAR
jgi:hypothetical protein